MVDQLFNGPQRARTVLVVDDTLFRLQEGRLRGAVAINHLEGGVRQCVKCGWTDQDARLNLSRSRQRALAHRLAGCLASARQALQGSTRSDCRGRRRQAKQGWRNRLLDEVKGEKKQRQLAKYLSGVKLARSWNQD